VEFALSEVFAKGGEGGIELAKKVVEACDKPSDFHCLYPDEMSIKDKIITVAKEIYGAADVKFDASASKSIAEFEALDPAYKKFPVCMAKTQYSLSDDQTKLGRPTGFTLTVREVKLSAGAGFVVALTGAIMTMPGLPKAPAALNIDVDNNGKITGLF
jgi:formate--tetrahydrofolate ligase